MAGDGTPDGRDHNDHSDPDDEGDKVGEATRDGSLLPGGLPSRGAYVFAFVSVVFAGAFGGIIGYGLVDIACHGSCGAAVIGGLFAGALIAAGGVGVIAVLVLRAMSEWQRGGKRAR
jgi:hypothetical protein